MIDPRHELDKLQAIYSRAMATNSQKLFFLALFEFVQEFDIDDVLTPVVSQILDQGRDDNLHIRCLENEALSEIAVVYNKVKKYVEDNKLTNQSVVEDLESYEKYNEGRIESSNGPTAGRYGEIAHALSGLIEWDEKKTHKSFVSQFGNLRNDGYVLDWTFSPSFTKWEEEKKKMERLQLTKTWYSWDQIVFFYKIYKDYEEVRHQHYAEGKIMSLMGTSMLFEELKCILEDRISQYQHIRHWDMEQYKMHLDRVFSFTKGAVNVVAPNTVEETIPDNKKYSYDKANVSLALDGKTVLFKKSGSSAEILAMLTANKRSTSQPWDEIYKRITGNEPGIGKNRKEKQKIYNAAENTAIRIARDAGITDFLIYDFERVRINPTYSRLEK